MAEKWIKGAIKNPGALRKSMGVKEGETITKDQLAEKKAELEEKAEGDKTLTPTQRKLLRQINLAQTLAGMKK